MLACVLIDANKQRMAGASSGTIVQDALAKMSDSAAALVERDGPA